MDQHAAILVSLPGLEDRLERANVAKWLEEQRSVVVDGRRFFVLGGDRLAGEAEAKLFFARERGLVSDEQVSKAAADQPLPDDVEAVDIKHDGAGGS